MKYRRTISLTCVLCLALSLLLALPAGAVDTNSENNLSVHAGTTMKCQVISGYFDGSPSEVYIIDVPIPAMATRASERSIIMNCVNNELGITGITRSGYSGNVLLSQEGTWTLPAVSLGGGGGIRVGGGRLTDDYSRLYIEMYDIIPRNGATSFNITVENSRYANTNIYQGKNINLGQYGTAIIMLSGSRYGDDVLYLESTDQIDVYAAVNTGSASVGTTYVSVS